MLIWEKEMDYGKWSRGSRNNKVERLINFCVKNKQYICKSRLSEATTMRFSVRRYS